MKSSLITSALIACAACGDNVMPATTVATHSSSIALSPSGDRLFVVNADADSISVLDPVARVLVREISLGTPVLDPATGAFTPSVMPRALAVSRDGTTLYVTGQRAGALFSIAVASATVRSVEVCSEPIGVLVSPDDADVFVACAQDDAIVRVDAASMSVAGRVPVASEPWALAWGSDGVLLVSHLVSPTVTVIDPDTLEVRTTWTLPDIALRDNDARLPHGQPRGLYDLAVRPGSSEVWIAHVMLGTDTPQPELDFESTVFPSLGVVTADGTPRRTLSIDVADIPRIDGSLGDIVSGPHALAFTSDGAYALIVDTNSEDVLVVDARAEVEASLLRPLPGHMPEGIALAADDSYAYIDERNTGDIAIVRLDRTQAGLALAVEGVIPRWTADPMPADLRLGQHLFYSANSDEHPITRNHWVACASCHIEGRSDAVTWRFAQGPRDTPSNAAGMLGTGFLFRTADRTRVQDYWQTVNVEQGGRFDPDAQAALLDPLAAYVNRGIPAPIPPTTDPTLVARGRALFEDATVGCADCHRGLRFTDSGNATLDLAGAMPLHDVGTCVTDDADFPDVAHTDRDGHPRDACLFDTPSLTGIASSPPYLHDGRAATLLDVLLMTRGTMGHTEALSSDDLAALVEYLRSL
jgi:DNA-binding beta-propeller fold protein YncE/mono/diheme cytochrome c family protein